MQMSPKLKEYSRRCIKNQKGGYLRKDDCVPGWSLAPTACPGTADKPLEVAVIPPIVVNIEDDDDEPLALRASSSSSRKRRMDTSKNSEPPSSKTQKRIDSPTTPMNEFSKQLMARFENLRDLMIKMFDEQNKRLDKLEEGMKNLQQRRYNGNV